MSTGALIVATFHCYAGSDIPIKLIFIVCKLVRPIFPQYNISWSKNRVNIYYIYIMSGNFEFKAKGENNIAASSSTKTIEINY